MISLVIPFYKMPNWKFFLNRCLESVFDQTFTDYEIILTNKGKWAENHNAGIRQAKGEYIKFLHMDDYFADDNALQILSTFQDQWLITACSNNPNPFWTENIWQGNNRLGGPSCLLIKNDQPELFDESLTWLVDCDYYMRLWKRYGLPSIFPEVTINIGEHPAQATYLIPAEIKLNETEYLKEKYS